MSDFDLLITGGTVVDGTGAAPYRADVAVRDGVIVAVGGGIDATGARATIDATGRLVTPGFVDVHTHYDGQATWDELLEPSTNHGITTVVMGNCGVGFAPVKPDQHTLLIELMEGVEDIPGTALHEGLTWGWESFGEYLDALAQRRWSVDVGTQLAHGPLRTYVMGERAARNEDATEVDIAEMAAITRAAMEAGAFGFTTSRTKGHRALDGNPVPGTYADDPELFAIGDAVAAGGGRIFEVAVAGLHPGDKRDITESELDWIGRLAQRTGLTATFIALQTLDAPDRWRDQMHAAARWRSKGASVLPLIAGRPFGVLWSWDVRHPFAWRPSYKAIAHLPLAERLAELRRPERRAAILAEADEYANRGEQALAAFVNRGLPSCFVLSGEPDYEQEPHATIAARAERAGVSIQELAYDTLLEDGAMLDFPLYNYADGDETALLEQLSDPDAIVGLADGGAHCATICDASMPSYMLTHWVRDRQRGPRLQLADVVRRLSSQPAELYGLNDRGRIAVGLRADLNVIDHDAMTLGMPYAVHDLPAGGTRLMQDATGYDATIVAGEVTRRFGADTGARPGRLLRNRG